jgi:hypothetical protein
MELKLFFSLASSSRVAMIAPAGLFADIVDPNCRVDARRAVRRAIARDDGATPELETRGLSERFAPVPVA